MSNGNPTVTADGLVEGVLELRTDRGGMLCDPARNLAPITPPAPVAADTVRKLSLRGGELLAGRLEHGPRGGRQLRVVRVNNVPVEKWTSPTPLADTVAIDPVQLLHFETPGGPKTMWVVQLFTPVGRGQRALIVAPPRTGKTILLQQMAHGIATNHAEVQLVMLLIDERPEEVTEMRRNVRGEVIASSNDRDANAHVRLARLAMERARRMVEMGQHVVILLDSITRLARSFNTTIGSSGRTMTGGLDIRALLEPKQIFGAARAVEGGGTLTTVGTALIDTGSRADEFIFQEFKGTGNMELVLSRDLANLRIWPAIDLPQSGTRKEEKLLPPDVLKKVYMLRRQLYDLPPAKAMQTLLERMARFNALADFLDSLHA